MQATGDADKSSEGYPSQSKAQSQKRLVEQLRVEWKQLWAERFNDKVKAEGISVNDYERLFVEKGTVIHATKDFKPLSFKDILQHHMVENPDRYIPPDVHVGGWSKFIKTELTGQRVKKSNVHLKTVQKPKDQTHKKGGRGWLHAT